ncbi:unnamed protein product, partial [Amoebophrya sp. A25]
KKHGEQKAGTKTRGVSPKGNVKFGGAEVREFDPSAPIGGPSSSSREQTGTAVIEEDEEENELFMNEDMVENQAEEESPSDEEEDAFPEEDEHLSVNFSGVEEFSSRAVHALPHPPALKKVLCNVSQEAEENEMEGEPSMEAPADLEEQEGSSKESGSKKEKSQLELKKELF